MAIPKILEKMRNSAQMNADNEGSFIIRDNDSSGVAELNDEALLIQGENASEVLIDPSTMGAVLLNAKPQQNGSLGEYTQFRIQGPSQYGELLYDTNLNNLLINSSWQQPNDSCAIMMCSDDNYQGIWANNSDYTEWMDLTPQQGLSIVNNEGDVYVRPSSEGPVIQSGYGPILMQIQDQRLAFKEGEAGTQYNLTSGTPELDQDVATKAYVDNSGGTFYAIYNTTTYQEIIDAFNAGKTCKALYSNETSYVYIFDLVTRPTSSNPTLYFVANVAGYNTSVTSSSTYLYVNSNSTWNVQNTLKTYINTPIYSGGIQTPLSSSTAYYRPIRTSTVAPTASDGYVGDIWIQYSL